MRMKVVLFLSCFAAAAQEPLLFGPYIQQVQTDAATVMWVTSGPQVTMTGGEETILREEYRTHRARFDHLKPDTEYSYTLEGGLSGKFRTAPAEPAAFRFVAYGDTRSNEEMHKQIIEAIRQQQDVRLVLNTGDLVSRGSVLENWKSFFRATEPLMRETWYVPCLGNHEDNAEEYFDFFELPGNEEHFSFNWGGIHFVALNTEPPDVPDGSDVSAETALWNSRITWEFLAKQRDWLDRDLAQNYGATFLVLFFHVPMYDTKLSRREPQIEARRAFGDVVEKHHVELVLNGHTHNYQHHRKGMTHFVVTGGGGASLYDIEDSLGPGAEGVEIMHQEKVNHFIVIDSDRGRLHLRALRPDQSLIEEFDVESQSGPRLVQRRLDAVGGLPWEKEKPADPK
ncbi:MAG: metallophosphoesterase [Candidatus Hydrogenedentes bacterium]|nr:metallophosphoesterase [Candidatus Hydrogenedentota bacterium]